MKKNHDDTLHDVGRAFHMIKELYKNKIISRSQMAKWFNVSEKTISRDITKLKDLGFDICSNQDGYYLKSSDFFNIFDQQDVDTLVFLQKILEKTQEIELQSKKNEFKERITNILEKIQKFQKFQNSHLNISKILDEMLIFSGRATWNFSFQYLLAITEAIQKKRLLRIHYKDESRIVEPMGVYASTQGYWLLIAYCRKRNDWRQFRIDRIQDLLLTDTPFKERDIFSKEEYPHLTDEERKFSIPKYFSTLVIESNESTFENNDEP